MKHSLAEFFEDALHKRLFTAGEVIACSHGQNVFAWSHLVKKCENIFDLASLTKPLCTGLLMAMAEERGLLNINDKLSRYLKTKTLHAVTLKDLLNHKAPLKDWHDFAREVKNPKAYAINKKKNLSKVLNDKKLLRRDKTTLYSDLGYMILGAVLENIFAADLDIVFTKYISRPLGLTKELFFVPLAKKSALSKQRFVPTEPLVLRTRLLQGEVMDENASVMGGVAGHAGLFGTANAVNRILKELRLAREGKSKILSTTTFHKLFMPDHKRPASLRVFATGFDTPTKPNSQSGRFFSKVSVGHLGYSGTSFWWDLKRDTWIIMLTNRCVFGRSNPEFAKWRPRAHDALMQSVLK